jgi:hypothetical protein
VAPSLELPDLAGVDGEVRLQPVLYMAMKTHGSAAITTVIMIRLRSTASRTCAPVFVTDPGEYRKVSTASHSGCHL